MEREPVINAKTAGTIAANLLREDGASGGNHLADEPGVRKILDDLGGISKEQIKEVLVFLSQTGRDRKE